MSTPPDPLQNVVFVKIPESLLPKLKPSIAKPGLMIPYERSGRIQSPAELTIESIIAGMLRVLIYHPGHQDADEYKTIVKALRPDIKAEFTQAGQIKAGLKDFVIAIEIFRALTALFPDDPVCAFNLALVYHDAARSAKGDPEKQAQYVEEAFQAYRTAVDEGHALPDTHLNFGFFLLEQENFEKALVHFQEYLKRETDESKKAPVEKIVSNLAATQAQDGLFKEAFDDIAMDKEEDGIRKVADVLEQHPDFWNGWFLMGWGLRRLGRYDEAKDSFLKALALAPPKPDLLNELAIVHMELGELEESYQKLNAALKLEPENVKVLSNLGVVCYKMGRRDEAEGFFRTVVEYSGEDPVAQAYLEILKKN